MMRARGNERQGGERVTCKGDFGFTDQKFIRKLISGGVAIESVYDVGAARGEWSSVVAEVVPRAKFNLFEPLASDQYAEFLANVMRERPDFRMHRVALGSENTRLRLNLYSSHFGNSLIDSDWEGVVGKTPVPVRRLDDYVAELGLPPADLIKMDTQGFELKILQGGESACRGAKVLMIETWLYRAYGPKTPLLGEIIEWLAPREFTMVTIGDAYVSATMELTSIDAFFLRNDVAAQIAQSGVTLWSN
jgi:FkbM family methyltransferase